jgi:hypothetical protein
MIPLTVCLCRRVAPDDQAAGRQKMFFSGLENSSRRDFKFSDSSMPTINRQGKQSQIIIFRVVSGRPDLGLCLRLTDKIEAG